MRRRATAHLQIEYQIRAEEIVLVHFRRNNVVAAKKIKRIIHSEFQIPIRFYGQYGRCVVVRRSVRHVVAKHFEAVNIDDDAIIAADAYG